MLWLWACVSATTDTDETAAPVFCSTEEEADVVVVDPCEDCVGTSMRVGVRLVTDVGLDPTAPEYTTYKDWTLTPGNGGVAQAGQTDGDGRMSVEVGEGDWAFASSFLRGGHVCEAALALAGEAGQALSGCALMRCPTE